jgi:16S rRNA C967 or C1407 C5-methylase (RsmB/RsmF family)
MGYKKGNKKKMWNRKKKGNADADADADGDDGGQKRKSDDKRNQWSLVIQLENPNFETYYAYQGLHSMKQEVDQLTKEKKPSFIPCVNDEEMEEERMRFLSTMRSRLPASFRIGRHLDEELTQKLVKDVEELAGKEMELVMDAEGNLVNKRELAHAASADKDKMDIDDDMKGDEKNENANANETTGENGTNETKDSSSNVPETFIKKMAPAKSITYVPNGYQLSVDRRTIKRNPALTEFHEWLKVQQDAGFITRQETVSMIPPVVLDAKPHHAVLDLCAAPGSKTSQMLEIIAKIPDGQNEPTGYVVANDSDSKRAFMLVHQLRRLNTPAYFITACDGQFFPMVKGSKDHVMTDEEKAQEGAFDRVLCDVPCTGDGTARKNPGIWKRWLATNGQAMHPLQVNITLNGARLTKVGGYLCYSTCSLNPIENEAVVAEILRATDGSLELVDKKQDMKGFIARPGWSSWKVVTEAKSKKARNNYKKKNNAEMRRRKQEYEEKVKAANDEGNENKEDVAKEGSEGQEDTSPEDTSAEETKAPWEASPPSWKDDVLQKRIEERGMIVFDRFEDVETHQHVQKSMFPPTAEEAKVFHLERCMRCLPQDMDTGGFFVALFRKCKPLGERARRKAKELEEKLQSETVDGSEESLKKKKLNNGEAKTVTTTESKSKEEEKDNVDAKLGELENPSKSGRNRQDRNYEKAEKEGFVEVDESVLSDMKEFYGLSESFAKNRLMARGTANSKLLYFISSSIKKNVFDRGVHNRVKSIHSGLRAFERRSTKDRAKGYRPCQESIHFIIPYMTKRKFIIEYDDFSKCIGEGAISIEIFTKGFCEESRKMPEGAFAVALKGYETNQSKKFFLTMWKCRGDHVNCLVARAELAGFRSKLDAAFPSMKN